MTRLCKLLPLAARLLLVCLAIPFPGQSLGGLYFSSHGAKATAMGGTAVALPQETTCALSNPAGLSFLGRQLDGNGGYFYLNGERNGNVVIEPFAGGGVVPLTGSLNTHRHHLLGEGGYNHPLNEQFTLGVTLAPLYGGWCHAAEPNAPGQTPRRSKVSSYFVSLTPNVAIRILDSLAIGVGVDIVMGRLKWQHGASEATGGVSEVDKWDTAWGSAVRGGFLWEAVPDVLYLGFAGQTPTFMSRFTKYRDFVKAMREMTPGEPPTDRINGPAMFSGGVSWHVCPGTVLATDAGYILNEYTDPYKTMFWDNQVFVKAGASQAITDSLTGMLGFNWYESPWKNIVEKQFPWVSIAPTFQSWRISAGGSYRCKSGGNGLSVMNMESRIG